jgi:hypothetical protein
MAEQLPTCGSVILGSLSPQLAKEFGKIIHNYDKLARQVKGVIWDAEEHVSLCSTVLRTVLTSLIQKFDIIFTSEEILQLILVQTLDSVPNLLEFSIKPVFVDQSALLASKVHYLEKLRIFKYPFHCTDEIILQLRLNCPHLKVVEISDSKEVTNASVQHLMELRELKFLDIGKTRIDDEHYGLILSELPNIANIKIPLKKDIVLRHIGMGRLDTITHISNYDSLINGLAEKFPNTTNITLTASSTVLSGLTAFSALRVLTFNFIFYYKCNMTTVIGEIGHRLTDLDVRKGIGVNLQEILTLCPSLVNFSLDTCTFSPLDGNLLDPNVPHFRNVINLKIDNAPYYPFDFSFIRYYDSLKTVLLIEVNIFTVDIVSDIMTLGTFKRLELLQLKEVKSGALTMEGLHMLIEHCPFLKRIEGLGSCPRLNSHLINELKDEVKSNNFDLEIEESVL